MSADSPDRPGPSLAETDDETGAHGRVGYGRYGRYSPLLLAIIMLLLLAVIAWLQWRDQQTTPAVQPGAVSGSPAPDVTLTLLDGAPLALRDLRGSVVVLNFWASWCKPCRTEMPILEQAHADAMATGERTAIVGVGIRTDQDADARALVDELGLTYPIGRDTDIVGPGIGPIERAFGLTGAYPSTIIIRPDGVVDRLLLGELTASQLRFAIDEARGKSRPDAT